MVLSKKHFRDQPIRLKLFYMYSFIVLLTVLLAGLTVYFPIKNTIEENVENLLVNATSASLKMVKTTAQASIKNYLRAVAEKNKQIVETYYQDVQNGLLSEEEAKSILRKVFFSQTIGDTGYIYCVNSKGVAVLHPNTAVEGINYTQFKFIQKQMQDKQGYLEYMWKNPNEDKARPKALYMTYFEPWDWIISVSSYRSEFNQLINILDIQDNFLSQTFGKTGYSYIIKSNGKVLIHPYLSGNLWDAQDSEGKYLTRHQSLTKNGKMLYSWKNPGETHYRDKIVIYNYIEEFDWIVASTSYIDEFYAPLTSARNVFFVTIIAVLFLVLLATFAISKGITRPLQDLESKLAQGAEGNLTGRMDVRSTDEIGNLARYFNDFMEKLELSKKNLQQEIDERNRTEELFAKAFHGSPSGIFIANLQDDRFINANQSFLNFTGLALQETLTKPLTETLGYLNFGNFHQVRDLLEQAGRVRDLDIEIINTGPPTHLGVINIETVYIWGEKCILGSIEDLTNTKRLEREIIDISEREQLQLGQYLHDDLSSHLLGIEVMLKVLKQKLANSGSSDLQFIDKIRGLVKEAITKINRISRGLSPTLIASQNLDLALEELCQDIEEIFDISCHLHHDQIDFIVDPDRAKHIYYITREAAYNAVKHGNAANILLKISQENGTIILELNDDGCGLPEDYHKKGMGISIMQYRARKIGGILDIRNGENAGTQLVLTFHPEDIKRSG